jgi:hypothetical protein
VSDPNQYKLKAEECREQARLALREAERTSWLAIAAEWEKLGEKLASNGAGRKCGLPFVVRDPEVIRRVG